MLLRTEQLTKDYGRYRALDHVDLSIGKGEVFGLLGPNGSGKTTALRLMLGFLRPTSGAATIAGHDCWHHSVAARRNVAYLPGELRLYENMTGRQLVRFLGQLRGHVAWSEADRLAKQFDIDLDRPIAHLSSGMKRKVALLQVLLPHVPLVILDEPTNTLDPNMRDELLEQLRQARQRGQTVLFSSHVLSEVEQVCDRVGILQRGRLAHIQCLTELRESRLIHARLREPLKSECLPPGLITRHEPSRSHHTPLDANVTWEYTGPMPPLLTWLATQPIVDLEIRPLGLSAIYQRYQGANA